MKRCRASGIGWPRDMTRMLAAMLRRIPALPLPARFIKHGRFCSRWIRVYVSRSAKRTMADGTMTGVRLAAAAHQWLHLTLKQKRSASATRPRRPDASIEAKTPVEPAQPAIEDASSGSEFRRCGCGARTTLLVERGARSLHMGGDRRGVRRLGSHFCWDFIWTTGIRSYTPRLRELPSA